MQICAPGPTPATRPPPGELADLLAERGDLDGLRARADAGDGYAADQLARLLAGRGDLDGLRARADAGARTPPGRWPGCWPSAATWTRPSRSCARADIGDREAAGRLARLLAERGDLDEAVQILRARAAAGAGDAWRLAELLTQQGQDKEAERLLRFGLNPDGSVACR